MMQSTRQVHMWFAMQEHEGCVYMHKPLAFDHLGMHSAASVAWKQERQLKKVAQAMSKMTTTPTIGIYFHHISSNADGELCFSLFSPFSSFIHIPSFEKQPWFPKQFPKQLGWSC